MAISRPRVLWQLLKRHSSPQALPAPQVYPKILNVPCKMRLSFVSLSLFNSIELEETLKWPELISCVWIVLYQGEQTEHQVSCHESNPKYLVAFVDWFSGTPMAGGWKHMSFKVPSKPNYSVTLSKTQRCMPARPWKHFSSGYENIIIK